MYKALCALFALVMLIAFCFAPVSAAAVNSPQPAVIIVAPASGKSEKDDNAACIDRYPMGDSQGPGPPADSCVAYSQESNNYTGSETTRTSLLSVGNDIRQNTGPPKNCMTSTYDVQMVGSLG